MTFTRQVRGVVDAVVIVDVSRQAGVVNAAVPAVIIIVVVVEVFVAVRPNIVPMTTCDRQAEWPVVCANIFTHSKYRSAFFYRTMLLFFTMCESLFDVRTH